jgi:hypothetical protein
MARPPKRQGTETFEITVSKDLFDSLVHIASRAPHGWSENTAAVYILTKEIERMQKAGEYGLVERKA